MKKQLFIPVLLAVCLLSPTIASAHERQVFEINGKQYLFVIGSLAEPVVVDDKTGVDLRIKLADPAKPEDSASLKATPVTGLEKTLKVEIAAGAKKKTFDLSPVHGEAGAYKAPFIPTVQTTYAYRVFGTIDATPFDFTFPCAAAGEAKSGEDRTPKTVSASVTRTFQAGSFGCPRAKTDLTFPETVPSALEISKQGAPASHTYAGLLLGALGVGFGLSARRRNG
ncbi:MAG: hypothetical protein V4674_02655 [Patescibacteria group bacterium]